MYLKLKKYDNFETENFRCAWHAQEVKNMDPYKHIRSLIIELNVEKIRTYAILR